MPKTSNILSALSVAIATSSLIVTIVWNHHQDHTIQQNTYDYNAMNFQPRLEVLEPPKVLGFKSAPPHTVNDSTIVIGNPTYNLSLTLINRGNELGRIVGHIVLDTLSGEDNLRRILFSKHERKTKIKWKAARDYFSIEEIYPGDTTIIALEHTVSNFSENKEGTIHLLVLYQNNLGMLYDLYYWVRFRLNPIPLVPTMESRIVRPGLTAEKVKIATKDLLESISFGESNSSRFVYRKQRADDIYNLLNVLREEDETSRKTKKPMGAVNE